MTVTAGPALPPVYLPRDVATALHCSEWWVKEQARRGRIPFSKVGRSYRFTADHFAEIMRIFESRPAESAVTAAIAAAPVTRIRQAAPATVNQAAPLRARTPRRVLRHESNCTAA
jgi:hypothetical protein